MVKCNSSKIKMYQFHSTVYLAFVHQKSIFGIQFIANQINLLRCTSTFYSLSRSLTRADKYYPG